MNLPFLVLHGALVWKVLLAGFAVAVFGAVRHGRYLVARAAMRRELARLERSTACIVRGKLGGGPVRTLVAIQKDRAVVTLLERAYDVWIDTADGRVKLAGTIKVIGGSRTSAARFGAPAATPEAMVAADSSLHRRRMPWNAILRRATLRVVEPGVEVVATGQLELTPSSRPSDYRTNASQPILRPPAGTPILVAARTSRVALLRLTIPAGALILGLALGVGWMIEAALGERWEQACDSLSDQVAGDPSEVTNGHVCALAAAMPESREDALHGLRRLWSYAPYRDRELVDRIVDVARLCGCHTLLAELEDAARYEQMISEARRCGDRGAEYHALVELGRFEEAASLDLPAKDGKTLVLAGRWLEAAAVLDTASRREDLSEHGARRALAYQCLAELLRHHGGEAGAFARLQALRELRHGEVCLPALAAVMSAGERQHLLASEHVDNSEIQFQLEALRRFDGSVSDPGKRWWLAAAWDDAETILAGPDSWWDRMSEPSEAMMWLADVAPPRSAESSPAARIWFDRWQAVASTLRGDFTNARQYAARAIAVDAELDHTDHDRRTVDLLPALIALYAGDPIELQVPSEPWERERWLHDFGPLLLRQGDELPKEANFGFPPDIAFFFPDHGYVEALKRAQHGDGRALARRMGEPHSVGWNSTDVMAVLPRIKIGRDAVVRQLIYATTNDRAPTVRRSGSRPYGPYGFPWSNALAAAARRAALRIAGEHAEEARWAAIYARYDRALHDRRKVIALWLWSATDWTNR